MKKSMPARTANVRSNDVLPCGGLAPLRGRCNAVSTKDIAYRLIGNNVAQISQCSDDAIITPARVLFGQCENQFGNLWLIRGRPGYDRNFDPSNFCAISWRYHARMVSGFATQATSFNKLRPSRLPISASVDLSGSESRTRGGRCARSMRFSAARYSFRSSNCWFTSPVTYANRRAPLTVLHAIVHHRRCA